MNVTNRTWRIAAAAVMISTIVWGYWWLTWALAIAFLFIFPVYYEIILWGIIYDALYGLPIAQFQNFRYVFTTASILFFVIVFFLKKLLLVYNDSI